MTRKVWAIALTSATIAAYGLGLFYEGLLARQSSDTMTFPFVDRVSAGRAYDNIAENAPVSQRAMIVDRLLKANPASGQSWALLSYVDWLRNGKHLSPAGVAALDRSYGLDPYDHDLGPWRVNFALENWDALSRNQRGIAISEASWILQYDWRASPDLKARLKTIRNPAGQAMAKLELVLAP